MIFPAPPPAQAAAQQIVIAKRRLFGAAAANRPNLNGSLILKLDHLRVLAKDYIIGQGFTPA